MDRSTSPHFRGLRAPEAEHAHSFAPRSISPCRGCARCAASRSKVMGFARPVGRSSPSSPGPIASVSAFVRLRSRARHSVHGGDRRPAGLPARPRGGAFRRGSALVHALKYGDRLDLAPMMGRWLAQAGGELLAEADALVPVPLHWRRHWARRFNQSALLAAAVAKASGVPIAANALKRVKSTPPAGGALAGATRRQHPGRVSGAGRGQGGGGGAQAYSGRRRGHVRRHGRGLRQSPVAGRRAPRRRAGFRQGCRGRPNIHIKS